MPTGWRPTSCPLTGGSFGYWRGLAAGSMNVGAGTLTAAGEIVRYDGRVAGARRHAQVQRLPALQRRHRGQWLRGDGARLHELLALHRPDPAACRARRDRSTASAPSTRPTAATPSAIRCRRAGRGRTRNPPARSRATSSTQTLNLYNNFTYFLDNPDRRRPVPADRQAQDPGPEREPHAEPSVPRLRGGDHARHPVPLRRHRRRPVQHRRSACRTRHGAQRPGQRDQHRPLCREQGEVDRLAALDRRRARRPVLGLGRFRHGGELGLRSTRSSPAPRPGWCSGRSPRPSSI